MFLNLPRHSPFLASSGLKETDKHDPNDNELLIKVYAASINDWLKNQEQFNKWPKADPEGTDTC